MGGFRFPAGIGGSHIGEQLLISAPGENLFSPAPSVLRSGQRYRVTLEILPDGRCGFALNGAKVWLGRPSLFEPAMHLMLAGNTVGTRMIVGHLRILTGRNISACPFSRRTS
jgi:hypothetical protein